MEDQINVLLAEDDKNLGTILKAYLEAKGFPQPYAAMDMPHWRSLNATTLTFVF